MSAACYVDPRNGDLYPFEPPRWCSRDRTPLLVTPGSGLSRTTSTGRPLSCGAIVRPSRWTSQTRFPWARAARPSCNRRWGDLRPFFKLEWFNPTGSFKDRGSTVMLSALRQMGVERRLGGQFREWRRLDRRLRRRQSKGQDFGAGGYVARKDRPGARLWRRGATGSRATRKLEAEAIRQSDEVFYASHNWQPLFLEGTKSLAYELWEDFGFAAPDNIIAPVGAGSSLLGCAFGFRELKAAGQNSKLPRLFAAQPLNCSPIDASYTAGVDTPVPREATRTIAEGAAIKRPGVA